MYACVCVMVLFVFRSYVRARKDKHLVKRTCIMGFQRSEFKNRTALKTAYVSAVCAPSADR